MSRDKQIEEMDLAVLNCYRNKYYNDGNATEQGIIANAINDVLPILVELKNGNYRKAYEVALEVIGEIETVFVEMIEEATDQLASARLECDFKAARLMEYGIDVLHLAYHTLEKSLKKKYTGERK